MFGKGKNFCSVVTFGIIPSVWWAEHGRGSLKFTTVEQFAMKSALAVYMESYRELFKCRRL